MTTHDSPSGPAHDAAHDVADDDLDARWAEQERVRKAVAAGAHASPLDRALYEALTKAALPALSADFAEKTAATSERLVDARDRIVRFRKLSYRLFGLLYLPAIGVAMWLFAVDMPEFWMRLAPEQRAPLLWACAVAALWSIASLIERWRSRRRSTFAPCTASIDTNGSIGGSGS